MEKLYFDPHAYFKEIFDAIDEAKESINAEFYIFNYDQVGQEFIARILQARNRGIKVKLTLDSIGSINFPKDIANELIMNGVELRFFNGLLKPQKLAILLNIFNPLRILNILKKLNKRTHRKFIIFDQKIIYSGSLNITQSHFKWIDFGIKIELPQEFTEKIPFPQLRDQIVRLNNSYRKRKFYYHEILYLIKIAQNKIVLVTPYFNPKLEMIRRLTDASKRGVNVTILTSQRSDVPLYTFLQKFYYPFLINRGVKIFEYKPKFLHGKALIIDHWAVVGSSNYNFRSLHHDLEIDIKIQDKKNLNEIEMQIEKLIQDSHLIDCNEIKNISFFHNLMTKFMRIFKKWF